MVDESSIKKWTRVQVDDRSEVDKKSVFDDRREFIHPNFLTYLDMRWKFLLLRVRRIAFFRGRGMFCMNR